MADALFLQTALETLTSLIKDEVGLIIGVDDEMKKLESIFTTIQAVLEDAELKQLKDKALQNWLHKLNDITYEIDDILDECTSHVARSRQLHPRGGLHGLKKVLFRHKIARRIKQALEQLDRIASERAKYHLRESDFVKPSDAVGVSMLPRQTGSLVNEPEHVFGREEEMEEIVDMLVNKVRDKQGISILPIIGMGGLGKTTLAQLVFNDPRVVEHFNTKMWVCVSDNFEIEILIRAIIESATGKGGASDLVHLDGLQRRLLDLLNHKRYLLVLDDVWSEDQEKWSQLRSVLSCGSTGSLIIVTTRIQNVAEIMGTLPTYKLKGLSEEQCWMLFKYRAFQSDEEGEQHQNLEAIGKQLIKKCAGVPLAAKALGGVLRSKRTEKEWIHVKKSEIWDLPQEGNMILPVLKLSYHHLPVGLRQCFAYCAIFRKDFKVSKDELLNLWMAHGYISSKGTLEEEDVGEQVLHELIVRSLLQIVDGNSPGDFQITMHDLFHDLAQSITKNKSPGAQLGIISTKSSTSKFREVSLVGRYAAFPICTLDEADISSILKKFNRLRVLEAVSVKMLYLPSNIGGLKHLRFLNLSFCQIRALPNSICNIWNLQVLILNFCIRLVSFPRKMRFLKNLRHLIFQDCDSLLDTPFAIRELTSLRTLSEFIVGYNKGHRLEELECLSLGGKLRIRHLERVKKTVDANKANLIQKSNLRDLSLEWEVGYKPNGEDMDEKILDALQPHPNVEHLCIKGFKGTHFPSWMKKSTLPKLVRMSILFCQNLSNFSYLEEFLHLEVLNLVHINIEYFGGGGLEINTCFPALKEMKLDNLHNLKGLFKGDVGRDICPTLEKLHIKSCPSLVLPSLNINLKELKCDNLLTLTSLPKMDSLRKLSVHIGKELTCIPCDLAERFPNLNELKIRGVHEHCVSTNGLQGFNSLRKLDIGGSETVTCLPKALFHHNSTLEEIRIHDCSVLMDIPEEIEHLSSLKTITVSRLPKMVSIPDAIKRVYSLESLYLRELNELTMLPDWLGDLKSLRVLYLWVCFRLLSLPDCIKGMMNLQKVTVFLCPNIRRRCEKGKGEDWHKIAHIPNFKFAD